jgi:hypothetical protein
MAFVRYLLGASPRVPLRHLPAQTYGSGSVLFGKWETEAMLTLRLSLALCLLLGVLVLGWLKWRDASPSQQAGKTSAPTIIKKPVNFSYRPFDPASPPYDRPPTTPGEDAACDSTFLSNASVAGQTRQADATHATLIITQVMVTLQLTITIWVPLDVTQHVIDHEEGHRQISEYYYRTADKVAGRIAASYIGKQVDIAGTDLDAESNKVLQKMAAEITAEYNRELNPQPTQLLYDTITDHSRNGVVAKDAVAHALKNTAIESTQP